MRRRPGRVVGVEPAAGALEGAIALFGMCMVRSTASATPFRRGAFDAALVLGVLSVVPRPIGVLEEARRLARALGVMEWCSTDATVVEAGGSRFPTVGDLDRAIERSGWSILQAAPLDLPASVAWDAGAPDLGDVPPDEQEVTAAISAGRLRMQLVVADRAR